MALFHSQTRRHYDKTVEKYLQTFAIPAAEPRVKNNNQSTVRSRTNGVNRIATVNIVCDSVINQSLLGPRMSTNKPATRAPKNTPTPRADTERVISS